MAVQHVSFVQRPRPTRRSAAVQSLCDCTHCTLYPQGTPDAIERMFSPVEGYGPRDARLILVGEAPGATEVIRDLPFVGESGKLLDQTLADVGLNRKDVYCTNAVLCRPPDNRDPSVKEIGFCNQRLKEELLSLPNRHVIVVLGSSAVKAVTHRNEGITSNLFKTEWSETYQCFLTYSYHPAACLRSADSYQDVVFALRHARDLLSVAKGPIASPQVDYTLEKTLFGCLTTLNALERNVRGFIACDVETTGLDWRTDTLTQLGFAYSHNGYDRAYLIPGVLLADSRIRAALKRLFARRDLLWIWHNGKFDLQFLKKYGIANVHVDIDTMLLNKCLDERSGKHGLKQLSAKYFGDYDYGKEKVGFTDPRYHGKDCVYTLRLGRDVLPEHCTREPLSRKGYPNPKYRHDTVLAPVWNVIMDIELRGVAVDLPYTAELAVTMERSVQVCQNECLQITSAHRFAKKTAKKAKTVEFLEQGVYKAGAKKGLAKPLKQKTTYGDAVTEMVEINLNSPIMLGHLLYDIWGLPVLKKTKTGQPSVDSDTLKLLQTAPLDSEQQAFFRVFTNYRQEHKLYHTYVLGALREAPVLDRAYPSIHTVFSFNPVTGRPSSADLPLQNISKDDRIRKMYVAREGYHFVEADYAQQEMRVAAWYSRDQALLTACMQGDFHGEVSRIVFRDQYAEIEACNDSLPALEALLERYSTYHQIAAEYYRTPCDGPTLAGKLKKLWRNRTKGINFGALYGQTPAGLKEYLLNTFSIDITMNEATTYHTQWFSKFDTLSAFLADQRHEMCTYGFVDTPMGHRRRKYLITDSTRKEAENQAMNSPVQSLASDMTMLAVIALHKELEERRLGHILFFVHDSIAFEIVKERLEEGARLIRDTMEHALDFIQKDDFYVPFPIDMKVGRGWGELAKYEVA